VNPELIDLLCLMRSTMSRSNGVESGWDDSTSSLFSARISTSSDLFNISCEKPHSGKKTDIAYGISHFFIKSAHKLTATLKFNLLRDCAVSSEGFEEEVSAFILS
jgi:hypothetical protein